MTEAHVPTEGQRRTFIAKLAQFRNTLPHPEQQMLDALVGAAVMGSTPAALAHYWVGPRLDPADFAAPTEPRPGRSTTEAYPGSSS